MNLFFICMNNQCSILICIYIFFNEKDKRAKPRNLPEGVAVSEIRALWIEKYFHLLSFGRLTGESSLLGPACVNVNKCI
jgi:hypothetical protein